MIIALDDDAPLFIIPPDDVGGGHRRFQLLRWQHLCRVLGALIEPSWLSLTAGSDAAPGH